MEQPAREDVASPRARRQLAQQTLTREQLLDTAEAMFSENGFDGTTLRAIAEAVEMSVGAVYLVFENKEALYQAVFARRSESFHSSPFLAAITRDESAFDRLDALVEYVLDFYRRHPTYTRLVLRHVGATLFTGADFVDPLLSEAYVATNREIVTEVIEYGQARGDFRPGDSSTMNRFLSAIMLTHLASDPALVGTTTATTPLPPGELLSLVRRVFEPLDATLEVSPDLAGTGRR
jgi:AcrR family transcriptional regulator